jgi:hypothetical protein
MVINYNRYCPDLLKAGGLVLLEDSNARARWDIVDRISKDSHLFDLLIEGHWVPRRSEGLGLKLVQMLGVFGRCVKQIGVD